MKILIFFPTVELAWPWREGLPQLIPIIEGTAPYPQPQAHCFQEQVKIHATGILTQTALLTPSVCVCVCVCVLAAQSCRTFCDPMDCSPPGSSVHGIPQAGILEWVAICSSRGSPQPRDWTCISHVSWIHYHWTTRETQNTCYYDCNLIQTK